MQHVSVVGGGDDVYEEGKDIHELSIAGIASLSNTLLENHPALKEVNNEMTSILQQKMLLKKSSCIPCLNTSSLGFIGLLCSEQSELGLSNTLSLSALDIG